MTARKRRLGLGVAMALGACGLHLGCSPESRLTSNGELDAVELALAFSLSSIPDLPPSHGNAYADREDAAEFGKALFFDKGLSGSNTVSCATCHIPGLYFTDGKALSVGQQMLSRHTPSIVGSQWATFLNWDGRADSLWSQALGPMESKEEMDSTRLELAHHIRSNYQETYEQIFGQLPDLDNASRFPARGLPIAGDHTHEDAVAWKAMERGDQILVNQVFANLGKAIEAYERKLVPSPAPFDRYMEAVSTGDPTGAGELSAAAIRGLEAFIGPAGCINCHSGPMFSDDSFHNIGLAPVGIDPSAPFHQVKEQLDRGRAVGAWKAIGSPFRTDGRYGDAELNEELEFLSPAFEDFEGAFRTPTLRNIAETAPYGHGGQHADLTEVIEWYRELPRVKMLGHRDDVLGLFDAEVETSDLVAFLESLTGDLPPGRWMQPD